MTIKRPTLFLWVNRFANLLLIFVFLLTVLATNSYSEEPTDGHYYEEYKKGDPNNKLKKRYKRFRKIYDAYSEDEKKALEKMGKMDFQKDNALLPYPRVLSAEEQDLLAKGVAQRGQALQAFLRDYYSGEKSFIKKGIIPQMVLDRIVKRHGEEVWRQFITPENLQFWYGPDIIRGPPDPKNPSRPQFRIVEDNTDFIGGLGDLKLARKSLEKNIPEYKKEIHSPNPNAYYDELADSYHKRAKKHGGIPVIVMYTKESYADHEDERVEKIFSKRDIRVVHLDPYTNNTRRNPRLETDDDGVWLIEEKEGKITRTKVGHMVANMNPQELEPSHPGNRYNLIVDAAKDALEDKRFNNPRSKRFQKLKKLLTPNKQGFINIEALKKFMIEDWPVNYGLEKEVLGVKGLLQAVFSGKVGLTNPPGLQFVNDKEFYMYMDDLIKFYLKEKPIIPNIQTESFARFVKGKKVELRKDKLKEVFEDIDQWVIKGVDGRGGNAVWVGPKMDKKLIPELKKKISANPSGFIFQRYTPLSIVDEHIVDLRLHSDVTFKGKVIVSPVAWGRAIGRGGDGKVNISSNGKEITVLVRYPKNRAPCDMDDVYIAKAHEELADLFRQ